MSSAMQNILVLIGLILVAVVGWYMYQENQRMTLDASPAQSVQAEIQNFISTQNTLRNIDIDTSILSDPAFQVLDTVTGPIPTESTGRDNPFAF